MSPGGHYGLSSQCNPYSTSNVPPRMDDTTKITGCTVWRATVWRATSSGATPYLGPNTGPTAYAPGGTHTTGTRRVRGHPSPKNKTPHGPLPQAVQHFFFFFVMKRFYYELLLLNLIHTRRRRDSGSKQQSAQRTELGRRDWDEGGKGSRGGGLVVLPGPPVSKGGPIRDERATGLLSVTAPTDE